MGESKALKILFPGPRRLILAAMFADPDRWWSPSELAGRAGVRADAARKHLTLLGDIGLVRIRRDQGRFLFQPDPGCPFFAEMHSMIQKLTRADGGGETILVVEDQPATAQITRILLESWGYRVLEAHSAREAFDLFERCGSEVRLLLSDVIMPEMNGHELASELRRKNPELRVVFMSGYHAQDLPKFDSAFLPKPFTPASLSRMVRKELDTARPGVNSRSE